MRIAPRSAPSAVLLTLALAAGGCADEEMGDASEPAVESAPRLMVEARTSGTDQLLQAVSPVGDGVVWVSGHGGTWGRSTDRGGSWTTGVVSGADSLQFRDVEGFDAERAVLLAAGPGPLSRLFRTDDGGGSWVETFVMDEPDGFLDCMAFTDEERGWAYGDAVGGVLYLLETTDGGRSWTRLPPAVLPEALESEGGFAASGACVAPTGDGGVAVATGNGSHPRLLRSEGVDRAWTALDLPRTAGPAAGATALGFGAGGFAWAVGGAIGEPIEGPRVALSHDGGASWTAAGPPVIEGPLYGGAHIPGPDPAPLVVVGPGGVSWSPDGGRQWSAVHDSSHWAVAFGENGEGWAVGPRGRITALRFAR